MDEPPCIRPHALPPGAAQYFKTVHTHIRNIAVNSIATCAVDRGGNEAKRGTESDHHGCSEDISPAIPIVKKLRGQAIQRETKRKERRDGRTTAAPALMRKSEPGVS